MRRHAIQGLLGLLVLAASALAVAGCGGLSADAQARPGQVLALGAENEYADVISQVGGRYVHANSLLNNPNTDPHTFEASPSVASVVSSARLIVQNGAGYDDFMSKLESASPSGRRVVIDVQHLLGLAKSPSNPHLWYTPRAMPAVATAVAGALSKMQPQHAAYFQANASRFVRSLGPWYSTLARLRSEYPRVPVATTEPVGDYMLQAAGAEILTPFTLQAAVMNGYDPSPQDITRQEDLLSGRQVRVLLYNQQVTDPLTELFLRDAHAHRVPVVGVYETMPPGYHYQAWMLAETTALMRALDGGISTERL